MASWPSRISRAAACNSAVRITTSWTGRSPASPSTPTWPPIPWSGWVAKQDRLFNWFRPREVGEKLVERIRWWERYTGIFGAQINNNPSPGNKEGGLTTIYEKSLGAIAKGGTTALMDVVHYAEPVQAKGLVVMDTPGYDPVSMTGIVAGGANVLVFTTGRGSVFGCKPAPSIKVATNTPMYEHMVDDMDINAGVILNGTPVEVVGRQIFDEILAVASGRKTKSEIHGVGEEEFAPWQIGPTL